MTWVSPAIAQAQAHAQSEKSTAQDDESSTSTLTSTIDFRPIPSTSTFMPPPPLKGFRNRTLVLNGTSTPSATASSSIARAPVPTVPSTKNINGEIMIDGVTFVSDPRGNKLVRKICEPIVTTQHERLVAHFFLLGK
jgi:hypothetical protein